MTAAVLHFQTPAHRHFFHRLDAVADGLAVLDPDAAAFVQREFGIDERTLVLDQPTDAVAVAIEDLFVGVERHDDVAIGSEAFLLVADEIGDQSRRHVFVVGGATPVVVAVDLGESKRIGRPIVGIGGHDVDMREQQDRSLRTGAAQPRHEIALARSRLEHLHVRGRETRRAQSRGHRVGGACRVACFRSRVDLDELFVDGESALLLRVQRVRGDHG